MVASLQLTSGFGVLISLAVLGTLFVLWLISLAALIGDEISIGMKIVWFVALTCLAPIAIPVYLVRRSRRGHEPAAAR